jgi:hypothetical protein
MCPSHDDTSCGCGGQPIWFWFDFSLDCFFLIDIGVNFLTSFEFLDARGEKQFEVRRGDLIVLWVGDEKGWVRGRTKAGVCAGQCALCLVLWLQILKHPESLPPPKKAGPRAHPTRSVLLHVTREHGYYLSR